MKKLFALILAAVLLPACTSTMKNGDVLTDFAVSATANQAMFEAQADVQWAQQQALKACFDKANNTADLAVCGLTAQSTNMSNAALGGPKNNRNPVTGVEAAKAVGERAVTGATTVGVANATADAIGKTVDVKGQPAPEPVIVRPEIVRPEVVRP